MMLPTHALVGLAIALPVSVAFPEFASLCLFSGLFGGVFPDFDLYIGHRKTLHFPVYYSVLSLLVIPAAVLVQTPWIIGITIALVAATVHSVMDIFGGGLELRPWEATSERAVYNHFHDHWIAPRRWVRYDGAPEDLLLSLSIAGPLLFVVEGRFLWIVVGALAVSVSYVVLRRTLATIAETLVENFLKKMLPDSLLAYLPARYVR
ncbi:metal-dependent hydrolase [Halomicroarcula nitratireducens]|uniref:Metal-dependent hydrolase n=1 Tax=Haloarcula nitratireducens TaxID=2487749 RepID=A0AAW4PJL0_9EURY|nr:metal-dependent hydrolase [Halomicroarcula nitratireducens]